VASARIQCPFVPCTYSTHVGLAPGQEHVAVPFHQGEGGAHVTWIVEAGVCPGTGIVIDLTNDGRPRGADAEKMIKAYSDYRKRLVAARDAAAAARKKLREQSPFIGGPVGRPVDWERPRGEYFPGRPADAPEPGQGEAPSAPVPTGVEGHHLSGRDAVDDSHAATVGLTRLALQQHGQAQEALSVVTELLERATAMAAVAETHVQSANSLVISAVGTGAGKPAAAEQMAEQTALATDTMSSSDGGNLHNAINLAKIRAETAHQQIAAATAHGQAYIGLLGG
jgi:hypothetical protein